MAYDIQEIKDRIDLPSLFRQDGHELRRNGSVEFCRCPFHEEKSGSCKVEGKRFHCFGCGAAGDCFDYYERSRGLAKPDAIAQLASIAGVAPDHHPRSKPLLPPKPRPRPQEEAIAPFTPAEIAEWMSAVDRLKSQPGQIKRIAAWRGYSENLVHWAIARGIIGLWKWSGIWREAFLVEMPEAPSGPFVPVTVHVRLGPNTRGNDRAKPSWRYTHKGRGSWPLVVGDVSTAEYLFAVEGQWDLLALVDLMGWHEYWPASTAVVGMRGATSFKKFIAHYAVNRNATVFAIADADNAGAEWFMPSGFIEQLAPKVRRIFSFWPGESGLDLNDLLIRGLDRPTMVSVIAPKLRSEKHRKASGPTFLSWCRKRARIEGDPHATAAAIVVADSSRPRGRRRLSVWERHWKNLQLSPEAVEGLKSAWGTYKSECR